MQAIIRTKAGKEFSTMKVQKIESPKTQSGELKVKMVSSRINPVDIDETCEEIRIALLE
ncbi:MAG: hypothetical protein JHD28_10275, partial [Bacteroidia bacterium]|nr:hypothetical protein [Bacteroidia bacterium]